MSSFIFVIKCAVLLVFTFFGGVHSMPVDFKEENERTGSGKEPADAECYFKIKGSQGSIYSPQIRKENIICQWEIDVMGGFVADLEFQHLRLPVNQERTCETYVEISYGTRDDRVKMKICPNDKVDRIHTDSQVVVIRYHFGKFPKNRDDLEFGFKINYSAVIVTKSQFGNNYAVLILLLSMATMCFIAVCLFCFRCRQYGRGSRQAAVSDEPNAPTRQQLQETFEFQRNALQADRKKMNFSIFQSQGSSFNSNLHRWASNPHLPSGTTYAVPKREGRSASIMTTPRSVFPKLQRKWSEDSVRRLDHLRTKLVARFSSAASSNASSDISVFFPASERRATYSQLSYEEDRREEDRGKEDLQLAPKRESRTASTSSRKIPSIVIEFVE